MMVTQDKDMIVIKGLTYLLNVCLGWFGVMAISQNVLNQELFDLLMGAMPSQVAMFFGFFYMIAIVFKKLSDSWTHHQINRLKVKEEEQLHKQSEIHTNMKAEDLKKKKNDGAKN